MASVSEGDGAKVAIGRCDSEDIHTRVGDAFGILTEGDALWRFLAAVDADVAFGVATKQVPFPQAFGSHFDDGRNLSDDNIQVSVVGDAHPRCRQFADGGGGVGVGTIEEQAMGRDACPLPNEAADLGDLFIGQGDQVNADEGSPFAIGVFHDEGLGEQVIVDVGARVGSGGVARQPNADGRGDVYLGDPDFPSHRIRTILCATFFRAKFGTLR
jgi:hypothetical protein